MSALVYTVRDDWVEQTERLRQARRRITGMILLVAVLAIAGVGIVDRIGWPIAITSIVAEAFSLCLYLAAAIWYGLHHRPRQARRWTLFTYATGLGVMIGSDLLTKSGLQELLVQSSRASSPRLLWGGMMLLFWGIVVLAVKRKPDAMRRVGLDFRHWRTQGPVGATVGLLIGSHLLAVITLSGLGSPSWKPWPYFFWQACYEIGPQSLPEELFLRGVVFNELYFSRGLGFWTSACLTAGLEAATVLVKQNFSADPLVIVGAAFYSLTAAFAASALFRWSRSILPGYASNVVFSLMSVLR
ncbi:MAG: hypothetical protein D6759_03870 [Chloroflexi bacterium]|nr:MAG: hypothetical protein D6759_03870 [Chloroflexota bacterium]